MKKIRIGFLLNISDGWLGGVNYYRNLMIAITENKDLGIEPILFVSKDTNMDLFNDYPAVSMIKMDLLARWKIKWLCRKILIKFGCKDLLLERVLKSNGIDILSHIEDGIIKIDLPSCAWIPDFQHKYLPHMFSQKEIDGRDKIFHMLAQNNDTVILSSYDAKSDFVKFFFGYEEKAEVLQFVVSVDNVSKNMLLSDLRQKYNIKSRFFFLPNQYWEHKNHKIVLEALSLLKQEGKSVVVVSSGNTEDYRNKNHFDFLKEYIKRHKLNDEYYVLGKIPYSDVQLLSQECLAFINPSLFEGWSTTVEEAKSMGKKILLSNIPVHLEQNPQGGEFFDPTNARQLANKMWMLWNQPQNDIMRENIVEKNKICRRKFAETYRQLLLNTIKRSKEKSNG